MVAPVIRGGCLDKWHRAVPDSRISSHIMSRVVGNAGSLGWTIKSVVARIVVFEGMVILVSAPPLIIGNSMSFQTAKRTFLKDLNILCFFGGRSPEVVKAIVHSPDTCCSKNGSIRVGGMSKKLQILIRFEALSSLCPFIIFPKNEGAQPSATDTFCCDIRFFFLNSSNSFFRLLLMVSFFVLLMWWVKCLVLYKNTWKIHEFCSWIGLHPQREMLS